MGIPANDAPPFTGGRVPSSRRIASPGGYGLPRVPPGHDLDHAVCEALQLNSHVPVLAASALARQNPGPFSLTPDFKPAVEIDLGAIGDGKVILCEAKSSSTLAASDSDEQRDTAKLIIACRALTADVLCLATAQPEWSPRTRATVQAECDRAGVSTLWLAGLAPPNRAHAGRGQRVASDGRRTLAERRTGILLADDPAGPHRVLLRGCRVPISGN